MKADLPLGRIGRSDQLFDRGKDGSEFFVVFLLQTLDLAGKISIAVHEPAKVNERPHDRDVHFDGALTPKDAGEHGDTLFGKSVWAIRSSAVFP